MNNTTPTPDPAANGATPLAQMPQAFADPRVTDAVQLLIAQHRALEHRMDRFDDLSPPERAALVAEVGDELGVHLASEEEVFYPAVRERSTEGQLLESLEEHLSLKRLLADLLAMDPADPTYEPKFKVLREQTEHHDREEEEDLFPKVQRLLDAGQREALGQRMLDWQHRMARGERGEAPRDTIAGQTDKAMPLD
ncbi:hemerythrin domain-containing protein [Aquabacterium sp. J223]|uniref:hemerythrin domain-containing protein n=1 Tax=Aquabacterium sp. J223 TaxID=2898431 RepID=UPI0021AD6711|nr:hemerythrin domain-containing protein [Aquabacterium sp. J223]UUX94775.1 hemerythrin domain-containing protein [Aquabacterium sp. J223]